MTHPEGAPPHTHTHKLTVNESTENALSHHPNERMARRKQQCFSSPFLQRGIEIA